MIGPQANPGKGGPRRGGRKKLLVAHWEEKKKKLEDFFFRKFSGKIMKKNGREQRTSELIFSQLLNG